MTSEHTDGAIVADDRGHQAVLRGERTEIVALMPSPSTDGFGIMDVDERIANARRLVAAWNACAGIETEDLEKGGEGWIFPIVEDFVQDTTTASENVKRMYDCATTNKARADEAETLLRRAAEQLGADGDLLNRLLNEEILTSDSDRTEAAVQESYGSETKSLIRAALAKTAPKPARLGDEGEG